jgi:hypothetical protein
VCTLHPTGSGQLETSAYQRMLQQLHYDVSRQVYTRARFMLFNSTIHSGNFTVAKCGKVSRKGRTYEQGKSLLEKH